MSRLAGRLAAASRSAHGPVDIFVIGGGINGCGIAREAAGAGLSVMLAEKGDLASGTSSWSTKLIHGGLRYLEHFEFGLVREALIERERLWAMAPHIIWPMRFVIPHHRGLRPAWLLRLGLFIYDHIGGRDRLPPTRTLDLRTDPAGRPLRPGFSKGFEYSDCWVNDARLVVLNAQDAAERGAVIRTRTEVTAAARKGEAWRIEMKDEAGAVTEIGARALVNAAGPWADRVLGEVLGSRTAHNVRLVKGSHIVVSRKYDDPRAFFFQHSDGRVIFAIPYEEDFTLIGTTDVDHDGPPGDVAISAQETAYLCGAVNRYFAEPVTPADVVWSYSGVRPLFDEGDGSAQKVSRDYVLKLDAPDGAPPLMNVFGGKITTFRHLAEEAVGDLARALGAKHRPWSGDEPLPGGDFAIDAFDDEQARLQRDFPFLEAGLCHRLMRLYGTCARQLLDGVRRIEDLGIHFGADLYEAEIRYLMTHEWARTAEDVLWRRTKRGLRLTADEAARLETFMVQQRNRAREGVSDG